MPLSRQFSGFSLQLKAVSCKLLAVRGQGSGLRGGGLVLAVRVGGDTGQPVVVSRPDSPAAKAFQAIAGQVAARISVEALTEKSAPTISIE